MMKLADMMLGFPNKTLKHMLPFTQLRQRRTVELLCQGYSVEICYTAGHTPVTAVIARILDLTHDEKHLPKELILEKI